MSGTREAIRKIEIPAGAADVARSFYGSLLGLVESTPHPDAASKGIWFFLTEGRLLLEEVPGFSKDLAGRRALDMTDLAEVERRLGKADVKMTSFTYAGRRRVRVFDPFGNGLELVSVLAERQPAPSYRELRALLSLIGGIAIGAGFGEAAHGRIDGSGGWPLGWGIGLLAAMSQLRRR